MNRGDVLRWTARRLPGVEAPLRDDLIASVDELAGRGSRADRALELGSLIGFALRSTSRRGAFDDRHELILQGVRVGALVLAIAGALLGWSAVTDRGDAAAAAAASIVAVAIAGGLRTTAVVLAATSVVIGVAVSDGPSALAVVVFVAVAAGHSFDARRCPVGAAVTAVSIAAGGLVTSSLGTPTATAVLTLATLAVPVGLLAVGWFDPRFAMAATIVWLWPLVAGVGAWVVGRSAVLAAGVGAAWLITDAAIGRCLTDTD